MRNLNSELKKLYPAHFYKPSFGFDVGHVGVIGSSSSEFPSGLGSAVDKVEVGTMNRNAHTNFPTVDEDYDWGTYAAGNYTHKLSAPSAIVDLSVGTWNFWFKLVSTSTIQALASISKSTATSGLKDNFWIHYRGDLGSGNQRLEVALDVANSRTFNCYGDTKINDTNWHMFTVSSNASTLKMYVDGTLQTLTVDVGSNSGQFFASATNADRLNDGSTYSSTSRVNSFTGYFDEHAIWNVQLSDAEISNLYNSGSGDLPQNVKASGLLAYWNHEQDPTSEGLINMAVA